MNLKCYSCCSHYNSVFFMPTLSLLRRFWCKSHLFITHQTRIKWQQDPSPQSQQNRTIHRCWVFPGCNLPRLFARELEVGNNVQSFAIHYLLFSQYFTIFLLAKSSEIEVRNNKATRNKGNKTIPYGIREFLQNYFIILKQTIPQNTPSHHNWVYSMETPPEETLLDEV